MDTGHLLVTVLISSRDNAAGLDRTLADLSRLVLPAGTSVEILVVDNGSSDGTDAVLTNWEARMALRRLWLEPAGLSRARNAGVAAASGALLLCTDDDVEIPEDWLAAYVEAYRTMGDRWYFGGPVVPVYQGHAPDPEYLPFAPASVKGLDWGATARALRQGEYFIGANWGCALRLIRESGGFDTRLGYNASGGPSGGGEETDLMARLESAGIRGWYTPAAFLSHSVPATKSSSAYIFRCWEAYATVRAWRDPDEIAGPRLRGVPIRLLARLARALVALGLSQLGVGDKTTATGRFRWEIGRVKGYLLPPRRLA
jgi:glycosyltransferase involved in cell wall biosynthesis